MDVKISHLYCYECSLQFDTKYVFDIHLSVTHGKKLDIKQEPDSQASFIPETIEFEIKHPCKGNGGENESKIRKVSIERQSGHKGKKQFNCDLCNAFFGQKSSLNTHVAIVHEGKKQFKCDICNVHFGQRDHLNQHVATVHEGKKPFECDICSNSFSKKYTLKSHRATVHEKRVAISM